MKNIDLLSFSTNTFKYVRSKNTRNKKNKINKKRKKNRAIIKIFKYKLFNLNYIILDILNGNYSSQTNFNLIIKKFSNNFSLSNISQNLTSSNNLIDYFTKKGL